MYDTDLEANLGETQRYPSQGNPLMILDERKHALEVNRRIHLEMDEIEELLELARKTDARAWCILTLAFNHGLRVSECAGGAPAIPAKNRSAIPPLMLTDIDMKHRTIRVRRLKGSLETVQSFVEHRGKPALSDYACLKAYFAVRIDDGSGVLFIGQKGPLHRWALNKMFVGLLMRVSDAHVARGLKAIPENCFRFHTLKHSVATIIAKRGAKHLHSEEPSRACVNHLFHVLRTP